MNFKFASAALALLVACSVQAKPIEIRINATDPVNPHSPRYGNSYRHGVVPTQDQKVLMRNWAATTAVTTGANTLSYMGGVGGVGVTSGTPKVYLIFWGTQWGTASTDAGGYTNLSGDPMRAAPYMQKWVRGLGTNGELWSGVMTQYCDGPTVARGATVCPPTAPRVGYPNGQALAGVWYDNAAPAPTNATGRQLALEAVRAAEHFGNTSAAANRYAQYIIMSPTGAHPDGFNTASAGFCAWHSFTGDTTLTGGAVNSAYGNIAFTNMPYVTDAGTSCGANFISSPLDAFSLVAAHEYSETITDQFPAGGWINNTGSSNTGMENADECAWIKTGQGAAGMVAFATGTFAMPATWSNDTNRCDIAHPIVTAGGGQPVANFVASPAGLTVSFTDTSVDLGGMIGARVWNFGDGASATTVNPTHTYPVAGTYTVTETITDAYSRATSTKTLILTVSPTGGVPTASFTYTATGLTAAFTDASTNTGGTIGTRTWNFGDGTTSNTTSPVHVYAVSGTYVVSLTVTDSSNGRASTRSGAITVVATTQLINNGGFESGLSAPWVVTSGVQCTNASCLGETANTGTGFAWFNGYGKVSTDSATQPITIPLGRKSATLAFYIHIDTMETTTSARDIMRVQVLSKTGAILSTLATYSNADSAPGYLLKKLDLSDYIGKSVQIRFIGTEDSALATCFIIDDVSVTVQ